MGNWDIDNGFYIKECGHIYQKNGGNYSVRDFLIRQKYDPLRVSEKLTTGKFKGN